MLVEQELDILAAGMFKRKEGVCCIAVALKSFILVEKLAGVDSSSHELNKGKLHSCRATEQGPIDR